MAQEMDAANRSAKRCACGSKVRVKYEPGCTSIRCLASGDTTIKAGPDWCPTELVEQFNKEGGSCE